MTPKPFNVHIKIQGSRPWWPGYNTGYMVYIYDTRRAMKIQVPILAKDYVSRVVPQ